MRHSDEMSALLARAARGDRRVLPALADRFGPPLLAMAALSSPDPGAATATALVHIWDEAGLFPGEGTGPAAFAQMRLRTVLRETRHGKAGFDDRAALSDIAPLPFDMAPFGAAADPDRAEALARLWLMAEDSRLLAARHGMAEAPLRDWLAPVWPQMAPAALDGMAPADLRLAAEIATGLTAPPRGRLAQDAVLRAAVALWRDRLALLAPAGAGPLPPAILAAVEEALFPADRRGWLARLGVIPAVIGAACAAGLAALAERLGWLSGS